MTYKAQGTTNSSGQDVQEPAGFPSGQGSNAILAPPITLTKPASFIYINNSGVYAFAYVSASGAAGLSTDSAAGRANYITGSIVSASATNLGGGEGVHKFEINPVAWRRCDGAADGRLGDITFVYKGK